MFKQMFQHKFITGIIILALIIGGYFGYRAINGSDEAVRYVASSVEKGTLMVSITGSGQVSVSNQVDIKPKVSGDIVYVGVKNGQTVKTGTLLAQIDSRDAQKAVRDAETALETAQLELEELLQPPDAYSLMQAEHSLIQAKDNLTKLKFTQESNYQKAATQKQKAEDNLEKAYEDAFNAITNAFLDLPALVTGLRDILYSYELAHSESMVSLYQWNISALVNSVLSANYDDRAKLETFTARAEDDYKGARERYDENFENYKNARRYSDKDVIEALLEETLETAKAVAEAVKSESNMLDYWIDYRSQKGLRSFSKVTNYQSDLKSYTSKTNSHLSCLLSVQKTIKDNKEAKLEAERDKVEIEQNNPLDLAAAERSIKEKEESLAKLKAAPDELALRAKEIAIQQKEDALLSAQQNLADHFIRAPFNGIVADISAEKGKSASSNTILASLITKQKMAEITLNEIDVAKVETEQKTTVTFDAIDDLSITGEVAEIDTLGTVTQGVVTYGVKIALGAQDERIKPGMSISAAIITNVKQNVLLVPNSAVKYQGNRAYVEVLEGTAVESGRANISRAILASSPPRLQPVQVGLSNDIMTEILGGLEEGERVVTQTIGVGTAQIQLQQRGGFGLPGMRIMPH